MKRKLLTLSLIAIFISTLTLGTWAYFTSEGEAHNIITTGSVKIELYEWANTDKTIPFTDKTGIVPGTDVTKIVEIKNTGESDAWIRVQVTKDIESITGKDLDLGVVKLNYDLNNWSVANDGYIYYNKPLEHGETTEPLFTTVTFDSLMNNDYQNATATIDVKAQAVQKSNNKSSAQDAVGWPES